MALARLARERIEGLIARERERVFDRERERVIAREHCKLIARELGRHVWCARVGTSIAHDEGHGRSRSQSYCRQALLLLSLLLRA